MSRWWKLPYRILRAFTPACSRTLSSDAQLSNSADAPEDWKDEYFGAQLLPAWVDTTTALRRDANKPCQASSETACARLLTTHALQQTFGNGKQAAKPVVKCWFLPPTANGVCATAERFSDSNFADGAVGSYKLQALRKLPADAQWVAVDFPSNAADRSRIQAFLLFNPVRYNYGDCCRVADVARFAVFARR